MAIRCNKLQIGGDHLWQSTRIAYVTGEKEGLLLEKPLQMVMKHDCYLDIEAERELANEVKAKHKMAHSGADNSQQLEKVTMKDLGFKRTMDALIVAYYEQKLPCFMGNAILDAIPGDMVVNAAMVAMATHNGDAGTQVVYHVTSSLQNPLSCHLLAESTYGYVLINPPAKIEGWTTRYKRPLLFSRHGYFHAYMLLVYKIPLQMLYAVNILLGGLFSEKHNKLNRSFNQFMLVAKFYTPYVFFKGRWRHYLLNTHIPAVLKFSRMKKEGKA
ncbi:hypothetical protein EJB05_43747, partial [Eragrostis curvula]